MKEEYPKDLKKVLDKIDKTIKDKSSRLEIIHDNMSVKLEYMKGDEFDLGRRNMLNYGHCFGHALETSSDYYVPHGIAVNIGMLFANVLSQRRGMLNLTDSDFVNENILLPNIPLALREKDFDNKILLESMKNDKKRVGEFLTIIIPDKEFKMIKLDDVTDDEFNKVLNLLKSICIK